MAIVIRLSDMSEFVGDTVAFSRDLETYLVLGRSDLEERNGLIARAVPRIYWKVVGGRLTEMDAQEKAAKDADELPALKAAKTAAIEERTDEVIRRGFGYEGRIFALDLASRTLLLGLLVSKDMLPYPVAFNTMDQRAVYNIADANEVILFYTAALGTVKAAEDSGTALKEAIRAATNQAELDAVVDSR